jgi:predicted NBD/HSP70 family sugar kinase
MKVLVIDIGGTHVKLLATGQKQPRSFDSGKDLTPDELVRMVRREAQDWDYNAVSLGYPGLVTKMGPKAEATNLGPGWVGFDFAAAFGKPVKIINDAAMQALGSCEGGRMLFLGLGTAVGSALVVQKVVIPLELGLLPFRDATLVAYLGREARQRHGSRAWQQAVEEAVGVLKNAFPVDYIVLGGGGARHLDPVPEGARRGGNALAFEGGFRVWETEVAHLDHRDAASEVWRVIY